MTTISRNAAVAAEFRAECARQRVAGRELARRLDLPSSTVARYLRGEVGMSVDDIEQFAAALGLSAVDIIERAYSNPTPLPPGSKDAGHTSVSRRVAGNKRDYSHIGLTLVDTAA